MRINESECTCSYTCCQSGGTILRRVSGTNDVPKNDASPEQKIVPTSLSQIELTKDSSFPCARSNPVLSCNGSREGLHLPLDFPPKEHNRF